MCSSNVFIVVDGIDCGERNLTQKPGQHSGFLMSPNFPEQYLAQMICPWKITASDPRTKINLNFHYLYVRLSLLNVNAGLHSLTTIA